LCTKHKGGFVAYTYTFAREVSNPTRVAWARSLPSAADEKVSELETQFQELASRWREETAIYSTMVHKAMNDNFLDIVGMGPDVIPCILREMERRPDHWFKALKHLAKTDPVADQDRGNVKRMTVAWLDWGRENGFLD
jgi:hypothetical protein